MWVEGDRLSVGLGSRRKRVGLEGIDCVLGFIGSG